MTPRISIPLTAELRQAVRIAAARRDLTVAELARRALAEAVKEERPRPELAGRHLSRRKC